MFSSSDLLASPLVSPESASGWMTRAATWPSTPLEFAARLLQPGSSSRTSLACFPVGPALRKTTETWTWNAKNGDAQLESSLKVPISPASFAGFRISGIVARGQCLTLNTSEWRSGASVCSLSEILETGDMPQRYFLSPKACAGILLRAEKRGKILPQQLAHALMAVAGSVQTSIATAA